MSRAESAPIRKDATARGAKPPQAADKDRSPLEIILEAAMQRGRPATKGLVGCTDRMLTALVRLQGDAEMSHAACDVIAAASPRVLSDAHNVAHRLATKSATASEAMATLSELSNMATIFARNEFHGILYKDICQAIRDLRCELN